MNEPPRPLSLGEILDRTVHFYRTRFLVFFGIAAVPSAVVMAFASAIFLYFAWWGSRGGLRGPGAHVLAIVFVCAIVLAALPIFFAASALASAAMSHAAARAYLGESTTIREAYKAVWPRPWRYIWLYILEAIILWVAPATVGVGILAGSAGAAAWAQRAGMGASGGALFGIAALLVVIVLTGYFLWMLLELSLAFSACVVEQIRPWAAIKRSASLSKGTNGRIFLLYLLGWALNWLISMAITMPLSIVTALIPAANSPQHAQTAGMVMLFILYSAVFAVQALTRPVYGIALMLFYYDQRIRQEGFDIEWMMQQAGLMAPAPPAPQRFLP